MARQRRHEDLHSVILDAAERLLAGGPEALTTRAVLREAGVSSGTLFHYFPSVDALVLAVAQRAGDRQESAFGDPEQEGVEAVLARLFDKDRRDTVLPWLRQRAVASPQLQDGVRAYDAVVVERYTAAFRAWATEVGMDVAFDVEAAVEVIRALAEGFQLRVSSDTLSVEPERFIGMVLTLIGALLPRPIEGR